MKRLTCLFVLFLIVGIASVAWAGAKEEVEEAIQQRIEAFHAGSAEGVARFHAEDAVLFSATSPFLVDGRKAIQARYAGLFKAFPTVRVNSLPHLSIRVYNGNTAVSSGYYVVTLVDKAGKARRVRGRLTFTRVKQGGRWLVVSSHFSQLPASR